MLFGTVTMAEPLIEVDNLYKHFEVKRHGLFGQRCQTVKAVDGISFTIQGGETVGLVGESGSGVWRTCVPGL